MTIYLITDYKLFFKNWIHLLLMDVVILVYAYVSIYLLTWPCIYLFVCLNVPLFNVCLFVYFSFYYNHLSISMSINSSNRMFIYQSLCLLLSICLSISQSLCLSVCLFVNLYIYLSICMSICLSLCLFAFILSICQCVCLSPRASECLSVCLSVNLYVYHQSAHLSVYLSIFMSICLFIYQSLCLYDVYLPIFMYITLSVCMSDLSIFMSIGIYVVYLSICNTFLSKNLFVPKFIILMLYLYF